jgi:hypothetical protein
LVAAETIAPCGLDGVVSAPEASVAAIAIRAKASVVAASRTLENLC